MDVRPVDLIFLPAAALRGCCLGSVISTYALLEQTVIQLPPQAEED